MMVCVGYPGYTDGRVWCSDHGRWHAAGDADETHAIELFFDALEIPDNGYYDRRSGVIDMQARDIVTALLAAGWKVPDDRWQHSTMHSYRLPESPV